MTADEAVINVYMFISDMEYCRFGNEDDIIYDLAIYAAECLIGEIYDDKDTNPIVITEIFRDRMADYAARGNNGDDIFAIYADAINNILEYYMY